MTATFRAPSTRTIDAVLRSETRCQPSGTTGTTEGRKRTIKKARKRTLCGVKQSKNGVSHGCTIIFTKRRFYQNCSESFGIQEARCRSVLMLEAPTLHDTGFIESSVEGNNSRSTHQRPDSVELTPVERFFCYYHQHETRSARARIENRYVTNLEDTLHSSVFSRGEMTMSLFWKK